MCVLLFHVTHTHKITSTIHNTLSLNDDHAFTYTCNKISDRSVSVNVILLRALSSFVLFFEIPILVDDIEIDMCVCVQAVFDGNKVIKCTGAEIQRMNTSNESMACNCMYYIYLSFAHADRMFQCHLCVSHCHPIRFSCIVIIWYVCV